MLMLLRDSGCFLTSSTCLLLFLLYSCPFWEFLLLGSLKLLSFPVLDLLLVSLKARGWSPSSLSFPLVHFAKEQLAHLQQTQGTALAHVGRSLE